MEAFALSWRVVSGFRAGKASGFGGEVFGEGLGALVGRILGFCGRIWAFVGEEAFGLSLGGFGLRGDLGFRGGWFGVSGFRGKGFGVGRLSGFRGDGFGFWWGGFRGRVSGFGGRLLGSLGGLSCGGSWAFVGRIRLS